MAYAFSQKMSHCPGRVTFILLVVLLLPEGFLQSAEASWIRGSTVVPLAEERAFPASPKPPYRLVFYDNMRYPVTAENGLPLAVWAHRDFSPLIAVDADPWVGVSVFRATSAESALADRLYANVQLRLILEEYERMQQRAREVLEGLGLHFFTPDQGKTLSPTVLKALHDSTFTASSEELSLEAKLERLRAAYRQAASDEAAAMPAEAEPSSTVFLAMTASPSSWGPQASQGRESGKPGASGSGEGKPVSASSASPGERPPLPEPPPFFGPFDGVRRSVQEEVPLPWVFRAGLALLRFVLTHKVEILAAFLIVFALFWVLAIVVASNRKGV